MKTFRQLMKAVKKARLESQLQRVVDRQAMLDTSLVEAEREAQVMGRIHEELTTSLAKKRTALRSQLIRL